MFDFIVLFDDSCGLKTKECQRLLDGVGLVVSSIFSNSKANRVQTMEFKGNGAPKVLVAFEDGEFQGNAAGYTQYIKYNGQCSGYGQ